MTLISKHYVKRTLEIETFEYSNEVPFYKPGFICEHTLDSNDTLAPLEVTSSDSRAAIPGFGAVYRLIGDGTHTPTFSGFNKSSGSLDYDATLATVNLIFFFFDGVEYWYSIDQKAT